MDLLNQFQGSIDDVRIYDRVLEPEEIAVVSTAETISLIASLDPSKEKKLSLTNYV